MRNQQYIERKRTQTRAKFMNMTFNQRKKWLLAQPSRGALERFIHEYDTRERNQQRLSKAISNGAAFDVVWGVAAAGWALRQEPDHRQRTRKRMQERANATRAR